MPPRDDTAAPTQGEEGTLQGLKWGLAPIRWGGRLSDEFRWATATDQPRRFQHLQLGDLRVGTYIWQPWLAQVTGNLGFVSGTERITGGADAGGDSEPGSRTTSLTGAGTLSLFPVSRFPFQASFDVSDSRASGQFTANDYVSKRITLRQSYQPQQSTTRMMASFDRSVLTSTSFGTDTVDAWNGSYSTGFDNQNVEVTGSRTTNKRSSDAQASIFNLLSARHTYRPDADLSVESLFSYNNSDLRQKAFGTLNSNRAEFVQANTFFTWRPDEELPLYITGGGRFFTTSTDNDGAANRSQSLSGNIAATYSHDRNLSLAGSATVVQARSDTRSALMSTQSGSANYVGDPIKFGNFSYVWNAGASLNNQFGGRDAANSNLAGQFGHSLARDFSLSADSSIGINAGQSVSVNADRALGQSHTLSHNAGASWRLSRDESLATFLSLTAADTRTTGANASQFQFVNFQVNGQLRTGRYAMFSANLTLQLSRQETSPNTNLSQDTITTPTASPITNANPDWTTNAYGTLGYQNMRLFGTPGLRYMITYSVNTMQANSRLLGEVNASRDQVGQSLEQRVDYRIGRMDVRLSAQVVTLDGKKNALIFLQVGREFGGF